jgi:flavin reductase (DIM6/NTAB) family NADH-FMN oxidoreductase RutF/DNA-binding GntR family transcriptional regulator
MSAVAADTVDCDVFRNVIGHFASGVTVITSRGADKDHGMTASAVTSLSMDPPMLLICINDRNPTAHAVSSSGAFAVNILGESQADLAEQFGRPSDDKFAGVEKHHGRLGAPVLADTLAHLECRVEEEVRGGTHRVFLARVVSAAAQEGSPLTYFRGTFGRFLQAQDDALYEQLRELVLSRYTARGERLLLDGLAGRLNADRAAVYHALTRLSSDGLVERLPGGSYLVVPMDAEALARATDARLVIELGIAEVTVASATAQEIAELRRRAEATAAFLEDLPAYFRANRDFHEHHIGLGRNAALQSAYRRLSLEGILQRSLRNQRHGSEVMVDDHLALAAAYEARDLTAAKATIRRHAERSREIGRAAVEAAGGSL